MSRLVIPARWPARRRAAPRSPPSFRGAGASSSRLPGSAVHIALGYGALAAVACVITLVAAREPSPAAPAQPVAA